MDHVIIFISFGSILKGQWQGKNPALRLGKIWMGWYEFLNMLRKLSVLNI